MNQLFIRLPTNRSTNQLIHRWINHQFNHPSIHSSIHSSIKYGINLSTDPSIQSSIFDWFISPFIHSARKVIAWLTYQNIQNYGQTQVFFSRSNFPSFLRITIFSFILSLPCFKFLEILLMSVSTRNLTQQCPLVNKKIPCRKTCDRRQEGQKEMNDRMIHTSHWNGNCSDYVYCNWSRRILKDGKENNRKIFLVFLLK